MRVPKSLVHWIEKVVRWCLKVMMMNVIDRCDVVVASEWNKLTSPCLCEEENIEKASGSNSVLYGLSTPNLLFEPVAKRDSLSN